MDQTLTNRTSEHICATLEDRNTSQRAEHSGNNKGDPVQMLFQLEWRANVLLGAWARGVGLMRDPVLVYAERSQGRMEIIVEKAIEGEAGNGAFASSCFHICSVAQSCPTLCDPKDYSLPGSSVYGILHQQYWSRLPFPTPGNLPNPGIQLLSPFANSPDHKYKVQRNKHRNSGNRD